MASLDRQSQIAYRLMYMISAVLITVSFFLSTVEDLINGMLRITFASDILITDYMEIAGVGAAFFNAGCVTLITLLLMRLCKLPMHGNGISTASLMAGFSFFGKNIVNMWFMLPGTILYARIRKEPLSKYLTFSLMSTSLGPLISSLLFANGFSGKSFLLALLTGTVIGFVAPPLCIHTNTLLHGLNLYNGGFAIGLLAMVLGSIFKCFGYTFEAQMYWYTGHNMELAIGVYLIAAGTVLYGLYHDSAHILRRYRMLLRRPGVPGHDFIELDGMGAVCMNIGVNLAFSVTLFLLVGGDLNGATIGALLTIAGFSAKGKHVGNIAPVMFGVLISVAVTGRALSPASQLALLFSTTLAPVAGTYGIAAGLAAGFLHSCVALYAGAGYSGLNLYNNGFAGGIVSIVLYAVLSGFLKPNTFCEPSVIPEEEPAIPGNLFIHEEQAGK